MAERIFHFTPRDAVEAARIFGACTRLRSEGRNVRAAVLEDPSWSARGVSPPPISESIEEFESLGTSDGALVIVSHAAMAGIDEVSRTDYLAVVGGGARFGDFLDAVSRAGLRFPHEPDARTREASVAGVLMAGAGFPTDERFGRLREWVLALELAIPKGQVVRTGSRAVKDVTGYDVAGFVIGCGGRCGMIARATFKLLPRPFGLDRSGGASRGGASDAGADRGTSETAAREGSTGDPRDRGVLAGIREKIYRVFDPAGIMSP